MYREALMQAAHYAQQLGLHEITLALFVEAVDDANRAKYEAVYVDTATGVTVRACSSRRESNASLRLA